VNNPLVSICVTTFNSAPFVVETLDSIKLQTYDNLELIISDDCSTDSTINICQAWLQENADRFVSVNLITVPHNTGVSANCNRCINAAKSDWIKFIAGDDVLFPKCIEDNMNFVQGNPQVFVLFSQVNIFKNDFRQENFLATSPSKFPMNIMSPSLSVEDQYHLLLLSDRISFTPSYFFNRTAIKAVGGYDEENKLVEDYPMWLKLTKNGTRLYFMNFVTVGYRQHSRALNNTGNAVLVKPLVFALYDFRKRNVFPDLPWDIVLAEKHAFLIARIFQFLGLNKKTKRLLPLFRILTIYLNPFKFVISFKKHLLKYKRKNILYTD
jgi:glycosyltransferase involved in cell wall biosynthesis